MLGSLSRARSAHFGEEHLASLVPAEMSADDFANTMKQINPAGTAFTAAAGSTARVPSAPAMEKELKHDEHKFKQQLASLQQSLEGTTRSLASLHSKRQTSQGDESVRRGDCPP